MTTLLLAYRCTGPEAFGPDVPRGAMVTRAHYQGLADETSRRQRRFPHLRQHRHPVVHLRRSEEPVGQLRRQNRERRLVEQQRLERPSIRVCAYVGWWSKAPLW